jgi:ABC-type multidrug transport system ATPase subunit
VEPPPDETQALVVCRGLGRSFGGAPALSAIDLTLEPGRVLGVVGPNGGGKSTLLLLLAGLLRPTTGSVEIAGIPAHRVATARRGSIGLITAEHGVYPLLTGRENLAYFGGLFGLSRDDVLARARPLLAELDLEKALDARVAHYSSGMRQKLSLVRATFLDPILLLLDEPTANLDPLSSRTIHRAVRQQAERGRAVVLVTHDLDAAASLCDRVLFLDGKPLAWETRGIPRPDLPSSPLHAIYEQVVRR